MRRNFLVVVVALLWVSLGFSQYRGVEPPLAEPDTPSKPANPMSVIELQPRRLPQGFSEPRPPISITPLAKDAGGPPQPNPEMAPAQFIQPVTAPAVGTTQVAPSGTAASPGYPEPATPVVKISVRGLDTAPTNQEMTYRLVANNTSEARAFNVIVRCPLPKNVVLVRAVPDAKTTETRELEWSLETLEPGASRQMDVVFKPKPETEEITVIGRVQFDHGRYVKTKIVPPALTVKKNGPAQALLGEAATYRIDITNHGKVPVNEIEIMDTLPEGLEYLREAATGAKPITREGLAAHQRAWHIGTLQPAEKRTVEYRVMPQKVGEWRSVCLVTGTDIKIEAGSSTAVVDAKLALQVDGPSQSDAKVGVSVPYRVQVHNTGTASLNNVKVVANFPQEMRLGKASKGGQFFNDAVQWVLPTLAPKETKELTMALIAPSSGKREVKFSVKADHGLEQRKTVQTSFDGIESLNWNIDGTAVSSIGKEVAYTITIKNPGSGPARNVRLTVDLPANVELNKAEPSFQRDAKNNTVYFNAVEIPPKQTVTYKVIGTARKSGEAGFHFEMKADGMGGSFKKTTATQIAPSSVPDTKKNPENIGRKLDTLPESSPVAGKSTPTSGTPTSTTRPPVPDSDPQSIPVTPMPMKKADTLPMPMALPPLTSKEELKLP